MDEVGVHRLVPGDEHHHRALAPASGPARLLPRAGDAAGIAGHDAGVERANINPQFQRVGAHHAHDLAVAQSPLDVPALSGQVAASVSANQLLALAHFAHGFLEVCCDDLNAQPASGKDDRLHIPRQEMTRQADRLLHGRAANAQFRIDHRRVVKQKMAFTLRRAVVVDLAYRLLHEALRHLLWIPDGRAAADELGLAAIKSADTFQPA